MILPQQYSYSKISPPPKLWLSILIWSLMHSSPWAQDYQDISPWDIEADYEMGLINLSEKSWLLEWINNPEVYCTEVKRYYPETTCKGLEFRHQNERSRLNIQSDSSPNVHLATRYRDESFSDQLRWSRGAGYLGRELKENGDFQIKHTQGFDSLRLHKARYLIESSPQKSTLELGHLRSSQILQHFNLTPYTQNSQASSASRLHIHRWQNDDYIQGFRLQHEFDIKGNQTQYRLGSSTYYPDQNYSWAGVYLENGGIQLHHLRQNNLDSPISRQKIFYHSFFQIENMTFLYGSTYHGVKSRFDYREGYSQLYYMRATQLDPYLNIPYFSKYQRTGHHWFWSHRINIGDYKLKNHYQESRLNQGKIHKYYMSNTLQYDTYLLDYFYNQTQSYTSGFNHSSGLISTSKMSRMYTFKIEFKLPALKKAPLVMSPEDMGVKAYVKTQQKEQSYTIYFVWKNEEPGSSYWKIKQSLRHVESKHIKRQISGQFQTRLFGEFQSDTYRFNLEFQENF